MGVRAGEEERGKERYMKAKSFFFFFSLYLKSKQANKQKTVGLYLEVGERVSSEKLTT